MEATLDRFGRIVIPKQVREDLGLDPGSVLVIEAKGDRIVLGVRRDEPDLVREDGVLVYTGEAVGDPRAMTTGEADGPEGDGTLDGDGATDDEGATVGFDPHAARITARTLTAARFTDRSLTVRA